MRDVGFENALYRAYHRWVVDYCAQAPKRLKWTLVANMRDVPSGVAELRYWAERDPNLVGVYISPQAPGGKLLDNPDLYPLYDAAQALDLPLLAHGGTARPPYGPGTRDLDGAWFLLHGLSNPWAGMAAMGALIGGGIFDLFPRIRAAIIETAGGWVPAALDRFDTHYLMSPGHVPNLKRMPRDVIAEGRYFHGIDSWERSIEFCVEELGEDMWLFAIGLAARRHGVARSRAADRRAPAPQRNRAAENPRRERDAAVPAAARVTRSDISSCMAGLSPTMRRLLTVELGKVSLKCSFCASHRLEDLLLRDVGRQDRVPVGVAPAIPPRRRGYGSSWCRCRPGRRPPAPS